MGCSFILYLRSLFKETGCVFCGKFLCFEPVTVKLPRSGEKGDTQAPSYPTERERSAFPCKCALRHAELSLSPAVIPVSCSGSELRGKECEQNYRRREGGSSCSPKVTNRLLFERN